jgi:hypothetical protein
MIGVKAIRLRAFVLKFMGCELKIINISFKQSVSPRHKHQDREYLGNTIEKLANFNE